MVFFLSIYHTSAGPPVVNGKAVRLDRTILY